jgi:hypothetical protein
VPARWWDNSPQGGYLPRRPAITAPTTMQQNNGYPSTSSIMDGSAAPLLHCRRFFLYVRGWRFTFRVVVPIFMRG